jgi:hypothetical protein
MPTLPPFSKAAILLFVLVAPVTETSSPTFVDVDDEPLPHEPDVVIDNPVFAIPFVLLVAAFEINEAVDDEVKDPDAAVCSVAEGEGPAPIESRLFILSQ